MKKIILVLILLFAISIDHTDTKKSPPDSFLYSAATLTSAVVDKVLVSPINTMLEKMQANCLTCSSRRYKTDKGWVCMRKH